MPNVFMFFFGIARISVSRYLRYVKPEEFASSAQNKRMGCELLHKNAPILKTQPAFDPKGQAAMTERD